MIKVKTSKIHGEGLFSAENIRKHTVLGTCETKNTEDSNMYTLWVGDDAFDVTCDFRFINHSNEPNVVYYDDFTVVALRDINSDEELTHDYG